MQTSPSPFMQPIKNKPAISQNKINHVTLVIDTSGSMSGREKEVIRATDDVIKFLAKRSQELDQETRITVYLFDVDATCVIYDKDVLRMPSLKDLYHATGPQTNLLGASIQAFDESKEISQRYGDHAFLFYVFTDGHENAFKHRPEDLSTRIDHAPENYTIATMVPNDRSLREAVRFGFPIENVQTWDTSKGIEEVGASIIKSTENYMHARAAGVRGTKSLFTMDVKNLNTQAVKSQLDPLPPHTFSVRPVKRDSSISEFVSYYYGQYIRGKAYYELMKPEMVQAGKDVIIKNLSDGKFYGGRNARNLLGLPSYDVKVQPESHPGFKVFIQSTSSNRKLIKGTEILVLT